MIRGFVFGLVALSLSACGQGIAPSVGKSSNTVGEISDTVRLFPSPSASRSVRVSNQDLFHDFLDLSFALESGQSIGRLSRFEGVKTIAFANPASTLVSAELDKLLNRLRTEADLQIQRVSRPQSANIVIETVSRAQLNRAAPNAACIVVPRMGSWAEFRKNRFNRRSDWSSLDERRKAVIFLPREISTQDARDCLHEEVAQALGPLNDMYRLGYSIFNDDNFHLVLTNYDMLMLRVFNAPELRSGMEKRDVAAVLPRVLARLNPIGASVPAERLVETRDDWVRRMQTALGARTSPQDRMAAAAAAVRIAKATGMTDHRLGFSYFALARVSVQSRPKRAALDYKNAYDLFRARFGRLDIHTVQAGLQMASLAISAGQLDKAEDYIETGLIGARAAQNARLLFSFLAMKAEIVEFNGQAAQARALRSEATGWARYGISKTSEIKERLALIAKLMDTGAAAQAAKAGDS